MRKRVKEFAYPSTVYSTVRHAWRTRARRFVLVLFLSYFCFVSSTTHHFKWLEQEIVGVFIVGLALNLMAYSSSVCLYLYQWTTMTFRFKRETNETTSLVTFMVLILRLCAGACAYGHDQNTQIKICDYKCCAHQRFNRENPRFTTFTLRAR